ncbi:MAG: 3-oxoacyl-[acyl-carrier-protein] reductase, partial [Candidatus Omnitrophica bacterium]|nr:3-oxoacyl-[acyl-carrier-protein] reductase [Candidatus Omnitrophota bacterium]
MLLANKVAIITGASRGLGKAIAFSFAKEGAKLSLCATNEELLKQVCSEIEQTFAHRPLHFAFDVREGNKVEQVVKKTLDTYSRIDILVNNAGATRDQLLALMSEDDWDTVLSINLKSVFLFTKAVTKPMIRQKSGRMINISSVVGLTGNAGQANYAASKGGIIALTKTVAKELAKRNITANAIAPGFIRTDMTEKLGEKILTETQNLIPLGRFGEPEDVANIALFLASDESSYITGQ